MMLRSLVLSLIAVGLIGLIDHTAAQTTPANSLSDSIGSLDTWDAGPMSPPVLAQVTTTPQSRARTTPTATSTPSIRIDPDDVRRIAPTATETPIEVDRQAPARTPTSTPERADMPIPSDLPGIVEVSPGLPGIVQIPDSGPIIPMDIGLPIFVLVDPHGTYADFKIQAAAPSIYGLVVSTGPVKSNDFANVFDDDTIVFTALSLLAGVQSEMEFRAVPLKLDTGYNFAVWAKDPDSGEEQLTTGTFKTLKRTLLWTIQKITVTDDSDDLSGGDIYFQYRVGGVSSGVYYYEVDTNDSVHPNTVVEVNSHDDVFVILSVLGVDDDGDDPSASMFLFWPGCSNSSNPWDVACGFTSVNVFQIGPGEEFTTGVNINASGHSLEFTIETSLHVLYEP